jgi:2-oxoglutarate dehydrogenase E1 component
MGAWRFVWERMQPLLAPTGRTLRYVGRPESASPAAGSLKRHQQEQTDIVEEALTPGAAPGSRRPRLVARRRK